MNEWSNWKPMPPPADCREIEGPDGPGVYELMNFRTGQLIQFGIGVRCRERMKSLYPKPFGVGTRKNIRKREYIMENWKELLYRTMETETREEAKAFEDVLKAQKNHMFNT